MYNELGSPLLHPLLAARWSPTASLLIANLAHRWVEGTDWEYSEFSLYDLGQAVAHMTLQAGSLSLCVRQSRAFNRDGLAAEFSVPAHWEVTTMAAVGRAARDRGLAPAPTVTDVAVRQRRPVNDMLWPLT